MPLEPYEASPDQVERFRRERTAWSLQYRCPDCVHVDPATMKCTQEYPNRTLLIADGYLESGGCFVFCKHFEAE
jgi:hypothetical protein